MQTQYCTLRTQNELYTSTALIQFWTYKYNTSKLSSLTISKESINFSLTHTSKTLSSIQMAAAYYGFQQDTRSFVMVTWTKPHRNTMLKSHKLLCIRHVNLSRQYQLLNHFLRVRKLADPAIIMHYKRILRNFKLIMQCYHVLTYTVKFQRKHCRI